MQISNKSFLIPDKVPQELAFLLGSSLLKLHDKLIPLGAYTSPPRFLAVAHDLIWVGLQHYQILTIRLAVDDPMASFATRTFAS